MSGRPLSVLFVADHLGYPGGVVHGATTYFLDVLPALAGAGVQVTACFLREDHPAARDLRERGVEPVFLGAARLDPFVVSRIAQLAAASRCSVIHAQGFKSSVAARLIARRASRALLIHVHDMKMPPLAVRLLNRTLALATDRALCVSGAVADVAARGYAVARERQRVVHTGIRVESFRGASTRARQELRHEVGIEPDAPVIAMIARFHPEKGHDPMLRMMREIVQLMPRAVLLMAGDGPERGACEALGRALGLAPNLRYLGMRRDVARVLAAADLVVMPSLSEGLGRAAIEANLAGRRVLAFDTGGLREVLDDPDCGRLVAAGDTRAFIDAAVEMLHAPEAADVRSSELRAQRATRRFGLEAHVARLQECYEAARRFA